MTTTTPARISSFTSPRSRDRFLTAYDRALTELWPVPVRWVEVETAAGTVHALRHGPEGDDPVVLLPGAGGNALSWYRHVAELGRTRPVLAVDPPGEPGRSTQTAPLADGARWLGEFLAGVGAERAHLVGTSFGGWTALTQQVHEPGRVAAVTLVDPAGFGTVTGRFYRWVVLGGLAGLLPAPLRRAAARRLVNGTLAEDGLMRLVRASTSFRRRLPTPPPLTDAEFTAVPAPVQLLLGQRSALHDSAAVAERVRTVVPGWRVELVPGTGHALSIEAPELVVRRVLEFGSTRRSD
ncbi:alpha/beta fold hydrolase [Modestobacter sp. VKM Ac-2979]|uniref:alpha/beta fold hydrolase n=1 Tax=unclassified Modestobacter TaxID=2643866 RepID=UPI0022AB9194|nr:MULTISPECIES: alpha/beta fold hydrolase [unclassified Modestobacter]MCZ2813611.1 alpha/beta fold hydrolase [Modestobacter sp. VKM Ac-2979]MCZ2842197.1 alpha/beta fold hydrolase [Modestobacter sp. VKM Ac-2980]